MVKLGQALALAIGGAVLSLVGFNEEIAIQSVDTITKLRLADIIIPSVTALLAVWVMWNYNITEERAREIKKQLEEKRLSYNLKPKKDVN
jgi:GPH family glycoside/pentoside/hexuronide:cation symporter